MRIRKKKWARPELEECIYILKEPTQNIGKWSKYFKSENPIYLDLGCGRGSFISKLASQNKDINFVAIDIKDDMLGYARRNIEEEYSGKEVNNVCLLAYDIERIRRYI